MAVEFRLLGGVEARIDGRRVDPGSPQQRCVLVVLLVAATEPVTADQLVERVWGERVPHQARETLRSYLSRLRRVLAPGGVDIVRHAGGYVLETEPSAVDLHRFRALVGQARATADPGRATALFDRALALWRGEAFAGLDTPWLNGVRDTLHDERVAAELDHADLRLGLGHHGELLADLAARAAARPLDERLAGQLMLALYRSGRQAEALDHFRRVQRGLAEELGVDVSVPLQDLLQRILSGDAALPGHTPVAAPARSPMLRQLPGAIPNFVGRAAELDLLTAQSDAAGDGSGTVVITSISGSPGIGKTSLAVHWARKHIDRFPDGQLYVDLHGFDPSGTPVAPSDAIRRFLDAFEVPAEKIPADPEAQAVLYRGLVEGKRLLIVLDNARDTDQVRPLLPHSPSCLVLVTSRHQLTGLVVREQARRITLDVLTTGEARELLASFLGRERVVAEADAVEEIVQRCAHLPLALSIVAARAGTNPRLPLVALVAELREERHRLTALSTKDSLDTDLRTVFSWSYRALPPAAARLFRLLGLHPGPDIPLRAAACLADLAEPEARELFAELVAVNLVQQHETDRYRCHDLLRAYAAELTEAEDTPDDRGAAAQRCLDFFLHGTFVAMAHVDPRGSAVTPEFATPPRHTPSCKDTAAAEEWLGTEYANLIAVVKHAARHGWYRHAWQIPHLLQYYFNIKGRIHDWVSTHEVALTAAEHLDDEHAQAAVHKNLALAHWLTMRSDEAIEHNHLALARYRAAGDEAGEGDVLNNLGLVLERSGRYEQAVDHYRQALPLRLATGNRRGEGATLQNLGNAYDRLGRYDEAVEHYHRALAIFTDLGERRAQAIVLGNLGIVQDRLGQYEEAVRTLQRCNALIEKTDDSWVAANYLTSLGTVFRKLGRHTEAVDHHRQALALIREFGDRGVECEILNNLGDTYLAMAEREPAVTCHREALALAEELDHPQEVAHAHEGIGHALHADDPDAALGHWRRALEIYERLHVPEADQLRAHLTSRT